MFRLTTVRVKLFGCMLGARAEVSVARLCCVVGSGARIVNSCVIICLMPLLIIALVWLKVTVVTVVEAQVLTFGSVVRLVCALGNLFVVVISCV